MKSTHTHDLPAIAVRGIASGLLLMAFFTFLWAGISNIGWHSSTYQWAPLIFVPLIVVFIIRGVQLFGKARAYAGISSQEDRAERKRMSRGFALLFGIEGLAIGVAMAIVVGSGHTEYTFPTIALIVALHFFPMAKLFRRTIDYYIAVWTTGIAIVCFYFTFHHSYSLSVITAIVGTGMAIGTSAYGIYMLSPAAGRMDKTTLTD